MKEWLIPLLCGILTGVVSAWGVGGGTLLLLVMTLVLGVDQRTAQGINLLFFLPTAAAALFVHRKNGFLDRPTVRQAAPWGAAAAAVGAWIATFVDPAVLKKALRPLPALHRSLHFGAQLPPPKRQKKRFGIGSRTAFPCAFIPLPPAAVWCRDAGGGRRSPPRRPAPR